MAKLRWNEVLTPKSAANAPIKNQASFESKEGWYPAFSATGQDVWLPNYKYEGNGIVVSAVGAHCGKSFKAHGKWNIVANTHALLVNEMLATRDYCWYILNNENWWIRAGAGQPFVKLKESLLREHDFPSLYEQKRITCVLDHVASLIQLKKQQIAKLDDLIKSRFIEMFGEINAPSKWEKKPWAELVTIQNGRDYKHIAVESGGYAVYGTGGEMARASDYLCPENTIIVGRKGTINNPLLVKEKFWNVDTAFGVIVGEQLHYQYFYGFCRMFDFSTLNKQAVLPSTTKADLLKIQIAVPPIELQKQFATFVKQIDKSKYHGESTYEMEVAA